MSIHESGIWLSCPHCEGSIQVYPGTNMGYFAGGKKTDVCRNCSRPLRLMQDCDEPTGCTLAIGSWNEWEFRNRGLSGYVVVRSQAAYDEDEGDSESETKRISA